MINSVMDYANQSNQILQGAADLMLQTTKDEAVAEQAEIEAKYQAGEISEEEYNKQMKESKKKAAKDQYKIEMVKWSSDLAMAVANVALGVCTLLKWVCL